MRILFTVGGGGHFAPALSVIRQLPKDVEYTIVGRKYTYEGSDTLSLEYVTAQKNNLPFIPITTGRLQRSFSKFTIPSLLKIPVGFWQAKNILQEFRPDVILSFGGYVSVPVVIAASSLRIPIVIHEQTQHAGLANKIASKFAKKICVSWKSSVKYFPKEKTVLTGNPVKPELMDAIISSEKETTYEHVFITGGSQGSHKINMLVHDVIAEILPITKVIHQTGDAQQFNDYDKLVAFRETLPTSLQEKYVIEKFVSPEEMIHVVSQASLVVSRAGINTITELLLLKKPALVIPLKDGQTNEQIENARLFTSSGLGAMIDEDTVTPEEFKKQLVQMISERDKYTRKKDVPEFDLHLSATKHILEVLYDVVDKKTN